MKRKLHQQLFFGTAALTCILGLASAENHNPCDYNCTQNLITQALASQNNLIASLQAQIDNNLPYLTSTDWSNLCTAGTPAQGCFGNVGSTAFQRFDQVAGGWLTLVGINSVNIANSVFIKEFFGGSGNTPTSYYFQISTPGALNDVKCQLFTQAGAYISNYEGLYTNVGQNYESESYYGGIVTVVPNTTSYEDLYYSNGSPGQYNAYATTNPVYVVCAGINSTNANAADIGSIQII